MKTLVTILFCALALNGISSDQKELKKALTWQMVKDETDSSLNGKVRIDGRAILNYASLIGPLYVHIDDSLYASFDSCYFSLVLDSGGKHDIRLSAENYYDVSIVDLEFTPNRSMKVDVYMQHAEDMWDVAEKPVVYLYSDNTIDVEIKLEPAGTIDFSYPQYNDGWQVRCKPNGKISSNGKEYDYLFWDGKVNGLEEIINFDAGFIVTGKNVVPFLEHQLTAMGLNETEQNDFITYWAPRMIGFDHVFVHFLVGAEYDQIAGIDVSPKPDASLRVFMVFKDYSNMQWDETEPMSQSFERFDRKGFVLVEWGGAELNKIQPNN